MDFLFQFLSHSLSLTINPSGYDDISPTQLTGEISHKDRSGQTINLQTKAKAFCVVIMHTETDTLTHIGICTDLTVLTTTTASITERKMLQCRFVNIEDSVPLVSQWFHLPHFRSILSIKWTLLISGELMPFSSLN